MSKSPLVPSRKIKRLLKNRLLEWFDSDGRTFAWRKKTFSPYQILLLEIILQRTSAGRVARLFQSFLNKYPDVYAISAASNEELESDLKVFGLQKRKKGLLKDLSAQLIKEHDGKVPLDEKELLHLPGVGRYVANAVMGYCTGKRLPLVDTNVARVIGRTFGLPSSAIYSASNGIWALTGNLLPARRVKEFNWGLIDLGRLICMPQKPNCKCCPLQDICCYFREHQLVKLK